MKSTPRYCDGVTRRDFLQAGTLGAIGLTLSNLMALKAMGKVASGSDENGVQPDRVLDTSTGEWSTLPEDPLKPSFDRMITATPEGLVLTAKPIQADGSPANPALVHAAVLPPGTRPSSRSLSQQGPTC